MNGYDRVTFGHPKEEGERLRNFIEYNNDSEQNIYKRNQSNQGFTRDRFAPVKKGINKQSIMTKLNALSEQLYEVIFLKESVMSMVGEQRIKMGDFMRQLKKYLFQLGVKTQRQSLTKLPRSSNENSVVDLRQGSSKFISDGDMELQRICQHLMKENDSLKQKYEQMLLHYRTEIQSLSNALSKPQGKIDYSNEQIKQLKQIAYESQQRLKNQQLRYAERVRYLQSQIIALEDQYLKEKESYERQLEQYRSRERQITFQESQIQRKNILLIERQKLLTERQIATKHQRTALDRRQAKVSDYEHNQLRRERQKAQQQRQTLRSEYYVSYDRIPPPQPKTHLNRFNFDTKSQREKSSGGRLINSRVDINARLKQIEMQRKGTYGAIKNSRMSQAGGLRGDRSSSKNRNPLMSFGYQTRKEAPPQNVNVKLDSMLQSLQRDLSDMK